MKKMYYSEILDKYFEDERECHKAELQFRLEEEKKTKAAIAAEEKKREEIVVASKEKKELSDAIETAKKNAAEAENEYELAYDTYKKKVAEIKETYNKAITEAKESILVPATEKVRDTQKAKYEAVKAFNDKFGTYKVEYTGAQAYNEMMKTINEFNKIFNSFWF